MTKPTMWLCAQRRLRLAWTSAQSDQPSLCAQWVAKDPSFLHADSEDSDLTGRMPRLIWVFAGHTCHFVGFVTRRLNYQQIPTILVSLVFPTSVHYQAASLQLYNRHNSNYTLKTFWSSKTIDSITVSATFNTHHNSQTSIKLTLPCIKAFIINKYIHALVIVDYKYEMECVQTSSVR